MKLLIILTCLDHCMNYSLLWPITDLEIYKIFPNTVTQHQIANSTLVVPSDWNVVILTLMYVISLIACNVEINCLHCHTYSLAMLHSVNYNVVCICLSCHMHSLALLQTSVWLKFHYSVWLPKLLETLMALLCSATCGVNVHLREKLQQRLFFIC